MPLTYRSRFCQGDDPYADVIWNKRDAKITEKVFDKDWNQTGERVVFNQVGIEAPDFWSDLAVRITAQKYFRGKINDGGVPADGREVSMRQLVDRVVDTIADWAGYADDKPPFDEERLDCMDCYESQRPRYRYHKRTEDCDLGVDEVYFHSKEDWQRWKNDVKYLLIHQYMWFNSPVWFNVGVDPRPQCSACFILRVNDAMSSGVKGADFDMDDHGLLAWQVKEGLIFANGSGSGVNLSRIRSEREHLSGGGKPTGPKSFAEGPDAWAGTIKSGGKSRRAAKMLILDLDHPDIRGFISVKAEEEKIAKILIANGYPSDMDGDAYRHARHQNSNLTTRANDEFFFAVETGGDWRLISRTHHFLTDKPSAMTMLGTEGRVLETVKARDLARLIARQCWESGDPGMQYADTIHKWHTCADTDEIYASNPCSEYLFLDETSCNLASLNLAKWFDRVPVFGDEAMVDRFVDGVSALTIAMDVIVSGAHYPTPNIRKESQKYRTLGVGYANLGGLIMKLGLAYDSYPARELCGNLTSIMTAAVYAKSVDIATQLGSFEGFHTNKESFRRVMRQHAGANESMPPSMMATKASSLWSYVLEGAANGHARNAQASVLAPTGTIAFSMDCDTTGIEPELGLVKYKQLSGGGNVAMPNRLVYPALMALDYSPLDADALAKKIAEAGGKVRGILQPQEAEVFRTSLAPAGDPEFSLPWQAHIRMMAAAQPFVSGAISKTINMPESATEQDIWDAYVLGWQLGLKAVAIYRNNCKATQPLSVTEQKVNQAPIPGGASIKHPIHTSILITRDQTADMSRVKQLEEQVANLTEAMAQRPRIQRIKPPREYHDMSRVKFEIGGHEGYLKAGFYPGTHDPCEVFIDFSKPGSTVQGITNVWCIAVSIMLQCGLPFEDVLHKFEHIDFEPKGLTGDPDVHIARSIVDFAVRKVSAWSQKRGPKTLTISEPERKISQPVFGEDVVEVTKIPVRNAGIICTRCGSPNVILNRQCIACTDCKYSEGGCFG